MKTRLYLFCALVCAMLTGCEALKGLGGGGDEKSTGTTTASIGGRQAERYDKCKFTVQTIGQTRIDGVWATALWFYGEDSDDSESYMFLDAVIFHDSEQLTAGTYSFPSIGAGSASGTINYRNEVFGTVLSGSITVAISGGQYTISIDDGVFGEQGQRAPEAFRFSYKGTTRPPEGTWGEVPLPDYPGHSTIVESASGHVLTPYMRMDTYFWEHTPANIMILTSGMAGDGSMSRIHLDIYTASSALTPGTYTATGTGGFDAPGDPGTFDGAITFWPFTQGDVAQQTGAIVSGAVTVSVSQGVYTVRLDEVTGNVMLEDDTQKRVTLDGTFTGINCTP